VRVCFPLGAGRVPARGGGRNRGQCCRPSAGCAVKKGVSNGGPPSVVRLVKPAVGEAGSSLRAFRSRAAFCSSSSSSRPTVGQERVETLFQIPVSILLTPCVTANRPATRPAFQEPYSSPQFACFTASSTPRTGTSGLVQAASPPRITGLHGLVITPNLFFETVRFGECRVPRPYSSACHRLARKSSAFQPFGR